jgi:hypothetical protein
MLLEEYIFSVQRLVVYLSLLCGGERERKKRMMNDARWMMITVKMSK